jgi:hypothetical protein
VTQVITTNGDIDKRVMSTRREVPRRTSRTLAFSARRLTADHAVPDQKPDAALRPTHIRGRPGEGIRLLTWLPPDLARRFSRADNSAERPDPAVLGSFLGDGTLQATDTYSPVLMHCRPARLSRRPPRCWRCYGSPRRSPQPTEKPSIQRNFLRSARWESKQRLPETVIRISRAILRRLGRLAQLVEHLVYTEGVGGSSPSPPISIETH